PPVADPGPNQNVATGLTVNLDGSGSFDADHDPLTYSWSFTSRPAGSNAQLSSASSESPTFLADVSGTYVLQLIANDGISSSTPVTVTITAATKKISLTPSPLNLALNASGTLVVNLSVPAGPEGLVVKLQNLGVAPGVVSVPS